MSRRPGAASRRPGAAARRPARATTALAAAGLVGLAGLTGCAHGHDLRPVADGTRGAGPAPVAGATTAPPQLSSPTAGGAAAARPVRVAPLERRTPPDVLVAGTHAFSAAAQRRLAALGSAGSVTFRIGTVEVNGHTLHVAAVDPSTFRRFAPAGTAESDPVWQTIARGEAAAQHAVSKGVGLALGSTAVLHPAHGAARSVRIGALATIGVPDTDLVVSDALGDALHLPHTTGMLLAGPPSGDPAALAAKVRAITGTGAAVDLLRAPAADPVAFLTGSRAAKAFGAFSYKYFPDGTIEPDADWVRANIVTATVPILGTVTCHRLMVPQLAHALADVQKAGLADTIHHYDGCYVPRFIEHNPTHHISLHTWGIAIDIDAATNGRGTKGTMDPRVVQIFKRWGFNWGGDWSYTDPMHFEIGALLQ